MHDILQLSSRFNALSLCDRIQYVLVCNMKCFVYLQCNAIQCNEHGTMQHCHAQVSTTTNFVHFHLNSMQCNNQKFCQNALSIFNAMCNA